MKRQCVDRYGIFYVLRTGSPRRDLPGRYGPYTTVYNDYNRWAKAGAWLRIFEVRAAQSRSQCR
jgi:transposase